MTFTVAPAGAQIDASASDRLVASTPPKHEMGVVSLGHIDPVPGTAAHEASFPWPTLWQPLTGDDLVAEALKASPTLFPRVLSAAESLVSQGARSILTTCGYFTPYQADLVRALPVPVLASSLLQLPAVLAMTGGRRVLVVAAHADAVDDRCLSAAGVSDRRRLVIAGLEGPGPFREQVLNAGGLDNLPAIVEQVNAVVRAVLAKHDDVGAVLLECGDLCLAASAVRVSSQLPVFDYLTGAALLQASVSPALMHRG